MPGLGAADAALGRDAARHLRAGRAFHDELGLPGPVPRTVSRPG
ncbi:hypothetical protein [Amycolatopsis vancoresmycina]|nr:hypothetical protein [Amycolatopsis vancoresmycina]